MRRTKIMTIGFVLIFLGIQLNLIESYELTPRFSNFLSETGDASFPTSLNEPVNTPYYQAAFRSQPKFGSAGVTPGYLKTITPPKWICWPVLFLGTVVFLHGFAKRRS